MIWRQSSPSPSPHNVRGSEDCNHGRQRAFAPSPYPHLPAPTCSFLVPFSSLTFLFTRQQLALDLTHEPHSRLCHGECSYGVGLARILKWAATRSDPIFATTTLSSHCGRPPCTLFRCSLQSAKRKNSVHTERASVTSDTPVRGLRVRTPNSIVSNSAKDAHETQNRS